MNSNRHRTAFVFKMLDVDRDGYLNSIDLLKSFEMISMESKFGKELHRMMAWFTSKNIKQPSSSVKKIITENINFSQFVQLLPNSM